MAVACFGSRAPVPTRCVRLFPESEQGWLLRRACTTSRLARSASRKGTAEPKIRKKNVMQNCSSVTDWETEHSLQTNNTGLDENFLNP